MNYESEVVPLLKKNLEDIRNIGALIHLRDLLVGYNVVDEPYYRFKDDKGNEIKDVAGIIALITEDEVELDRVHVVKERYVSSLTGCRIKLKNVIMEASEWRPQDNSIRREFGVGKKNLVFVMSYKLDGDDALPLKINYIDFEDVVIVEEE